MNNLFSIEHYLFNGFFIHFLNVVGFVALFAGVLTIITKNPVVSVLFLILLFGCIATYLIFIGLKFIGLSYLLVYVGAVSILFLFILMLINIRVSELISDTSNNIPVAVLIILTIFVPFSHILDDNASDSSKMDETVLLFNNIDTVMLVSSKS